MRRYSSFRYQVILKIILLHVPIVFLTGILYFFGGFDVEEFHALLGVFIFILFGYFLALTYFDQSRVIFLKNPETFDILWVYIILISIGILVSLKAIFNVLNFNQLILIIKALELTLFLLGNLKKKKTPGGL